MTSVHTRFFLHTYATRMRQVIRVSVSDFRMYSRIYVNNNSYHSFVTWISNMDI